MKTKQEQIEEMAKFMHYKAHGKDKNCDNEKCEMCWCSCKNDAELLYSAGYRKASDVIDEFVERVKERLEEFTKQDYEDGVPYYHADCEQIDNVIDDVADEMRQEVEK